MPKRRSRRDVAEGLHEGMVVFGLIFGALAGAVWGLLNAPRSGAATRRQITESLTETSESLRDRIDDVVSADPVSDSIAEGKAAAHRRRIELGLAGPDYPAAPPSALP